MAEIRTHKGDISDQAMAHYTGDIAVDTETLGLVPRRDRLCVVQLSPGDGTADVIQIAKGQKRAPNLVALLKDRKRRKLFHYGRFDIAVLYNAFGVSAEPVFCTKIASRLTRTYTDRHGLKDVTRELLEVGSVQTTAILRLGRRDAVTGATRICRLRCSAPACADR